MGKEAALPPSDPTSAECSWGQHGGKEPEVLHANHLEGSQEEEKKCLEQNGQKGVQNTLLILDGKENAFSPTVTMAKSV